MKSIFVSVQTFLLVAVAAFAFAAAPDPGAAGAGHPAWAEGPQGHHPHMWGHLDLSKEQKEKMHEMKARHQDATRDLRYDLAQKALEMKKLFTDPKTDDATLLAKQKELNSIIFKLIEKRGEMRIEWRKILTPEQIKKLDRMPMGHGMECGEGHGMGPGMGHHMGPGMGGPGMAPGMAH